MSLDIAFNPPQFDNEYDGVKMRQFVEELERLHSILTSDTDDEGVAAEVTSFNTRVGDVVPIQADYDAFFLTPAEGDALFLTPAEGNAAYSLLGHTHGFSDLTDFDFTGAADNDMIYRSAGTWVDTAGAVTWDGTFLTTTGSLYTQGGTIYAQERAAALTTFSANGQFWVRNDVPNIGMFTDDDDDDWRLNHHNLTNNTYEVRANTLTWADAAGNTFFFFDHDGGPAGSSRMQLDIPLALQNGVTNRPVMYMQEIAAAVTDFAGFGQWWVRDDVANTPMFTDDAGVDGQLARLQFAESVAGKWVFQATAAAADDGGTITLENSNPGINIEETDAILDEKNTIMFWSGGDFQWRMYNDTWAAFNNAFEIVRAGNTLTSFDINGALTATSYGGILENNLVSRIANESISGSWTWTGDLIISDGTDVINISATAGTTLFQPTGGMNLLDFNIAINANSYNGINATDLMGKTGTPVDNQVAVFTAAQTIEGDAGFTWDGTTLRVFESTDVDAIEITPHLTTPVLNFSGATSVSFTGPSAGQGYTFDQGVQFAGNLALDDTAPAISFEIAGVERASFVTFATSFVLDVGGQTSNDRFVVANGLTDMVWIDATNGLRVFETGAETDYIQLSHTGVDGVITTNGAADLDLVGPRLKLIASSATKAGINIPEGVAPTVPEDGDVWVTAAGEFFARLNGVSVDLTSATEVNDLNTDGVTWTTTNRVRTDVNTPTPPVGAAVTGFFEIRDNEDVDPLAQFGFTNGSSQLFIRNLNHGGEIRIHGEDAAGIDRTILQADPDSFTILRADSNLELQVAAGETAFLALANGESRLYHNNVHTTRTDTTANGGLEVNNLATGAGFERVLTVSDIGATISGTPVNNQVAVWTSATAIEGDAGFTWDGTTLRIFESTDVDAIEFTPNLTTPVVNFSGATSVSFTGPSASQGYTFDRGGQFSGNLALDSTAPQLSFEISGVERATFTTFATDFTLDVGSQTANNRFTVVDSLTSLMFIDATLGLRIYEAGAEVDYINFLHNGTNAVLTTVGAGDLDLVGPRLHLTASTTTRASMNLPEGTAPTTPEDGDFWVTTTDAFVRVNGVNESIIQGSGSVAAKPGLFRGATNVNITTTEVTLDLTSETFDPDTNYSLATDVITVTDAGYYLISYSATLSVDDGSGNTHDDFTCRITKNGTVTEVIGSESRVYVNEGGSGNRPDISCANTFITELAASDTIRLRGKMRAGTNVSQIGNETYLSIMKIRVA